MVKKHITNRSSGPRKAVSVNLVVSEEQAMTANSGKKGREFETEIKKELQKLVDDFPKLVTLTAQKKVKLNDGRIKVIDFALEYLTMSAKN
ncbi:MAG: hypothetical protein B6I26_07380 [Desulfobacteraceae bacterium 4572_130]|nr:MAG: hypothetical protein B6I26_07380 [Desulfobacteraceae bacterium 4572_130]